MTEAKKDWNGLTFAEIELRLGKTDALLDALAGLSHVLPGDVHASVTGAS